MRQQRKVMSILSKYRNPLMAKGKCQQAVAELADAFREQGKDFEVYSFRNKKAANHILVKQGETYYDPTGSQYGQTKQTFPEKEIPADYRVKGKVPSGFYTLKR